MSTAVRSTLLKKKKIQQEREAFGSCSNHASGTEMLADCTKLAGILIKCAVMIGFCKKSFLQYCNIITL